MKPCKLDGLRFGKLSVIRRAGSQNNKATWLCVCDCGNTTVSTSGNLNSGTATSCGCSATKHGHTVGGVTSPTFKTWHSMIGRCLDQKHKNYSRYGGRGITVDPAWLSFSAFLSDMGARPVGMTLDRRDNDAGYCRENCRWADINTQANNKRSSRHVTVDGVTRTVTQWAKHIGMFAPNIYSYSDRKGVTMEAAIVHYLEKHK
jgi:hypothetical protein